MYLVLLGHKWNAYRLRYYEIARYTLSWTFPLPFKTYSEIRKVSHLS